MKSMLFLQNLLDLPIFFIVYLYTTTNNPLGAPGGSDFLLPLVAIWNPKESRKI